MRAHSIPDLVLMAGRQECRAAPCVQTQARSTRSLCLNLFSSRCSFMVPFTPTFPSLIVPSTFQASAPRNGHPSQNLRTTMKVVTTPAMKTATICHVGVPK